MPRILPRLIEKIKSQSSLEKWIPSPLLKPRKKPKSLYKPVPPRPSFKPASYPRSILLQPENPVVHAKDYVRHKTLPPTLCRPKASDSSRIDVPRQMTEVEFGWWANPYLRMMVSPLRKCAATMRHLPSDLLVRLVGVRVPASVLQRTSRHSQSPSVLVPDGVLHPRYTTRRRTGGGVYVLCSRRILQQIRQKGLHSPGCPGAVINPRTEEHIAHLLRLRVVQEFELLAERLEYALLSGKNQGIPNVILRRLTREEWISLQASRTVPYPNAVAVLVVPSVNNDRTTKQRPTTSMSPLPPVDDLPPKESLPVSTLLPAALAIWGEDLPESLPLLKIPLYNGVSAFPSRSQRAALHDILQRILRAERYIKRVHTKRKSSSPSEQKPPKASHAFVLYSDVQTAKRGDPASIARALWRLRMYESEGWVDTQPTVHTN